MLSFKVYRDEDKDIDNKNVKTENHFSKNIVVSGHTKLGSVEINGPTLVCSNLTVRDSVLFQGDTTMHDVAVLNFAEIGNLKVQESEIEKCCANVLVCDEINSGNVNCDSFSSKEIKTIEAELNKCIISDLVCRGIIVTKDFNTEVMFYLGNESVKTSVSFHKISNFVFISLPELIFDSSSSNLLTSSEILLPEEFAPKNKESVIGISCFMSKRDVTNFPMILTNLDNYAVITGYSSSLISYKSVIFSCNLFYLSKQEI